MSEIDWELVGRYAAGECTDAERGMVEQWLVSSPGGHATLRAIARVVAQADMGSSAERRQARFARLQTRVEAHFPPRRAAPPVWRRHAAKMKMAASAVLVLGGSLYAFSVFRHRAITTDSRTALHTVRTTAGQRRALRLADGTQVTLGPASTLRFSPAFGTPNRVVELDGEAVFQVTHDARRPFAVKTARFEVRDLGTRFVVTAYADDTLGRVAVAEGRVAVGRGAAADSMVLSPGDGAQIARDGRVAVAHDVELDGYFRLTEGRLVFRRAVLSDALRTIERWHDVHVDLASPELAGRRFSASFDPGESTAAMLQVIGSVLSLNVRQIDRNKFVLTAMR